MNIKDIASIAHVSASTVSKIINNKDYGISEETRQKVLKIINEYQYSPYSNVNVAPKNNIIGLLVPSCRGNLSKLVEDIQHTAANAGYSVILANTGENEEDEEKQLKILASKKVGGIILFPVSDEPKESVKYIKHENIPMVLLNYQGSIPNITSVFSSDEYLGYIATNYLLQKGHKEIGYIALKTSYGLEERIQQGYLNALYEHGILIDNNKIFIGKDAIEAGNIGAHKLMNSNVTAILCQNSEIACCTYQMLKDGGINIPRDISIISAMDSKMSLLLNPSLNAVEKPSYALGRAAMNALIEIIEKKKEPDKNKIEITPVLNERESVSVPLMKKRGQGQKIIVVGSMNMDVTINVHHIPTDGETLMSSATKLIPGGKGANQAVGAGKLGGLVYAIGRLGSDTDGQEVYSNLVKSGVKTDGVLFDNTIATGKAYINVSQGGESTIVLYAGANQNLDRNQIKQFKNIFDNAKYCLLSMEIPENTAEYTIQMCVKKNVKVILKPSAIENIKPELLDKIEYIVPNKKELDLLVPGDGSVEEKADYFYKHGVKNVIVTLGHKGCYLKNDQFSMYFPATDFVPLDTTGGADAFISALAVFLSEGADVLYAIRFATYAAGLSITRVGVQPALPDRGALDIYQDEVNAQMNGGTNEN